MNRWSNELKNHEIHKSLSNLESLMISKFDNISEEEVIEKRRFLKVINVIKGFLDRTDPELISFKLLNSLNKELTDTNLIGNLNSYLKTRNIHHLITANEKLNDSLEKIRLIIDQSLFSEKYISNFIKDNLLDSEEFYKRRFIDLSSTIEKLADDISLQQRDLSNLENRINTKEKDINSQLTNWQKQFSESQEKRSSDFFSWRSDFEENSLEEKNELINAIREDFINKWRDFKNTLNEFKNSAEDKHSSIVELYGLVAGDSVASSYQQTAEEEKSQANKWRWGSITFIIACILWLLFALYISDKLLQNDVLNWPKILLGSSISAVLLWGAAYCSQQSTKHRENQKQSTWFALQMKAIDPFIHSLTPKEQSDVKQKLTDRLFSNPSISSGNKEKILDHHALGSLTKTLTDLITELKK